MIVLDTNVLSEVIKERPYPAVLNWMRSVPASSMFTTSLTCAELLYGVRVLPPGQRRSDLDSKINQIIDQVFTGRVLGFDAHAADAYATLAARLRQQGRPMSQADAMIAGIVLSRGAKLVTRNVRDFADAGCELIDPWSY